MRDPEQTFVDNTVADHIKSGIRKDIQSEESEEPEETSSSRESPETPKDPPEPKKQVDKKDKDSEIDDNSEQDEAELYEAVVSKVLNEQYDGDESKLEEARAVANVALKTFNGDPIKAAKSYKGLRDQTLQFKQLLKQNPFIEKLVNEARSKGKVIDETYVRSLIEGPATSNADQPIESDQGDQKDQFNDDFNAEKLMNMGAADLIEEGVLDKTKYEAETPARKKEMLQQARLDYAMNVVPVKVAERSLKLTKEKQKQAEIEKKKQDAADLNKERLNSNFNDVVQKYNVDFDANPEHAKLFDEIKEKAYKIPDLDDDTDMLVAPDAVEQAIKFVFNKHDIPLKEVDSPGPSVPPSEKPSSDHKQPLQGSYNTEAYARILGEAQGFKGLAGQSKKKSSEEKEENPNSIDARVKEKVNQNIQRNYTNSHLISGARQTDRRKGQ